jgi:AcrR family transcriptional regulator
MGMPEAAHFAVRMNAGDRRRQLLDAALELFSRKGFGGATTKEIAASAGVTEAIIFRHFPSKTGPLYRGARLQGRRLQKR